MSMQSRLLPLVAACLVAQGCATPSIYRTSDLPADRSHIVSIDAKQRVLVSTPVPKRDDRGAALPSDWRYCAEPPPDVFSALAASLGAEASLAEGADPSIAAKLAYSISENAATIERSQTVNVLREAMYRNCERYLNDGISRDELIIQAARDQQLIVQVLAIEQITGVARAQATAIETAAKAAASGVTDTGIQTLAAAKKDYETRRADGEKIAAAATALPPVGACAAPLDPAAPPAGATAAQVDAKNAKCAEQKKADERTKEAQAYFATVQDAVARQSAVSSEASGEITSAAQTPTAAAAAVAAQIVEIVKQNHAFDEIGMTCVVRMRSKDRELPPYCENLLAQMARTRQAQLMVDEGFDLKLVDERRNAMAAATSTKALAVWNKLASGQQVPAAALDALAKKAGAPIPAATAAKLAAAVGFAEFERAFTNLSESKQTALGNAAK